jgi:hypothetical protein
MNVLLPGLTKQIKYQRPISLPEIIFSGGSSVLPEFKSNFQHSHTTDFYLTMDFGKRSGTISFLFRVFKMDMN